MGRLKGQPKTGGRKAGTPNRVTALLKESILTAADEAGKQIGKKGESGLVAYLTKQAVDNPGPFMALLGKVLPMQMAGDPDAPVFPSIEIQYVSADGTYTNSRGEARNVKDSKAV